MYSNLNSGEYNIRKGFVNPNIMTTSQFDGALDEPTYLSFKLNFYSDEKLTDNMMYNDLPQGLFTTDMGPYDPIMDYQDDTELREFIANYQPSANIFKTDRPYSALLYLMDRNEDFRAYQLAKFIKGWNELQEQYQYYFQSISGIDEIFKSTPDKGMKISKDAVLTVECLEGIDQKVKYLLSLYRSAAWDDEYQRWILPDIYRFFKMDIFISEIRTFQRSSLAGNGSAADLITNTVTNLVNKGLGKVSNWISDLTGGGINNNTTVDAEALYIINGIAPVTCIHCEMCDFDVNGNLYNGSYNINNADAEKTTFKIKVKKAEVIYNWTLMDRVFGNLISNWERGHQSITASEGWRDYLGIDGGPLAQDTFNNTTKMSETDKTRYYTQSITSGYIAEAVSSTLNAVSDAASSDNILDLAADLYTTVRNAVSQGKAQSAANTESSATSGGSIQINVVGATANTALLADAAAMIAESPTAKTEREKQAVNLLKQLDKQYKDLNSEQQKLLQAALDSMNITSMVDITAQLSQNDRSWATDLDGGREVNEISMEGATPAAMAMQQMKNVDYEIPDMPDAEIKNTNLNLKISDPSIQKTEDRSWATDLDGQTYSPMDSIKDTVLNLSLTEPEITGAEMTTKLTDPKIQSEDDRSWATELDGGRTFESPDIVGAEVNTPLTDPEIQKEDDRSWATELDGGRTFESPDIVGAPMNTPLTDPEIQKSEDRSMATDLDGQEYAAMDSIKETNLNLALTDAEIQPTELDLHLSDPHMQTVSDRSMATDLDNTEDNPLTIEDDGYSDTEDEDTTKNTSIIGGEINDDIDRSTATELDGGPYYGTMASINPTVLNLQMTDEIIKPTELNISLHSGEIAKTELDLKMNPEPINPTNLTLGMNDEPIVPTELQFAMNDEPVSGNTDKLSDVTMGEMTGYKPYDNMTPAPLQNEKDRSWATELDGGQQEIEMSLFEQIAASQATTRTSIEQTPIVTSEPVKELVLVDGGIINPEATVADVIQQYIDISDYKKAEKIEGANIVDSPTVKQTSVDPNGYKINYTVGISAATNPNGSNLGGIKETKLNLQMTDSKIVENDYKPKMIDVRPVERNITHTQTTAEIKDNKIKKNTKIVL